MQTASARGKRDRTSSVAPRCGVSDSASSSCMTVAPATCCRQSSRTSRMLAWVRAGVRKEPLPRISKLPADERLKVEDRHVRERRFDIAHEALSAHEARSFRNASTAARSGIPACPPGLVALMAAAAEATRIRSASDSPRARDAA